MARTTVAAVQLILDTSATDAQIEAFIDDANAWINVHLEGACDQLTTAILITIEKYLSAYFVTLRDARLLSERLDDVQEKYQRDPKVSEYLRAAIALDPCGIVREEFLDQENNMKIQFRMGEGFDDKLDLPTSS